MLWVTLNWNFQFLDNFNTLSSVQFSFKKWSCMHINFKLKVIWIRPNSNNLTLSCYIYIRNHPVNLDHLGGRVHVCTRPPNLIWHRTPDPRYCLSSEGYPGGQPWRLESPSYSLTSSQKLELSHLGPGSVDVANLNPLWSIIYKTSV